MGEAKRRKLLEASNAGAASPQYDRELVAKAVRQVVGALTSAPAADCLLYAIVGAALLNQLGVKAHPVAGSAAWRVGPGDSDVINHAPEAGGAAYVASLNPGAKAAMYHAWIRTEPTASTPAQIIDLTTWQLAKKARELDAADGGTTQVVFCPDSIWETEGKNSAHPQAITQSFKVGVYSYIRKPALEPMIYTEELLSNAPSWGLAALLTYRSLESGQNLQVMGLGEDGQVSEVTEDTPLGLKRVRP